MANNNYKVIRVHELLPHEKCCVESDFSHLNEQDLKQLAPSLSFYAHIIGTLDANGFAYVELPLAWKNTEIDITIEAPDESGWSTFWHNASSLVQIGGSALMLVAAGGVSTTGIGSVIGVGLTVTQISTNGVIATPFVRKMT